VLTIAKKLKISV